MWLKWLCYNVWFRWLSYHVCSGDCLTMCAQVIVLPCVTQVIILQCMVQVIFLPCVLRWLSYHVCSGNSLTMCDSSDYLTMYGSGDCLTMCAQVIVLPCVLRWLSYSVWLRWLSYHVWFRWLSYNLWLKWLSYHVWFRWLSYSVGSGDCLIMFVQMIVLPCTAPCLSHFVLFFEKIWLFFLLFLSILRFFNYLVLLCSHAMCSLVHKILFLFNFIIFIFFIEILQLSFQCSFSDNVKLGIKRKYLIFFCKHFSFYCLNLHIYKLYHIWYTF